MAGANWMLDLCLHEGADEMDAGRRLIAIWTAQLSVKPTVASVLFQLHSTAFSALNTCNRLLFITFELPLYLFTVPKLTLVLSYGHFISCVFCLKCFLNILPLFVNLLVRLLVCLCGMLTRLFELKLQIQPLLLGQLIRNITGNLRQPL